MTKTYVRSADSADFSTLLSIDRGSFPPGIAYSSAELSYFMRRPGAQTLVAEIDGEIVGFILVDVSPRRKAANMVTLDISARHRRKGYATELFLKSERVLIELAIERYELQVDVENASAIAFYRKHGFEMERTLKRYYANGNDAYFMSKALPSSVDKSS